MRKRIIIALFLGIIVVTGCSDSGGGSGDETLFEYYYRIEIPEGFQANILYSFHNNPIESRESSEWTEHTAGVWESAVFEVSPLSQTPNAQLRARQIKHTDPLGEETGTMTIQIIVDGEIGDEQSRELPIGNASFAVEYDFSNR